MSDLREKLLAAVAFDPRQLDSATEKRYDHESAHYGMRKENARLRPFVLRLIDCAVACEERTFFHDHDRSCSWHESPKFADSCNCGLANAIAATKALERAVEE